MLYCKISVDSCMAFGIHYEEFPTKSDQSGAPSCAMQQTAAMENGWMRDKTGDGMMQGKQFLIL